MPKLRNLSGKDVIKILSQFHFDLTAQRGSHVKLVKIVEGHREVLTVPNHDELDKGTLKAIFGQSFRYISEDEFENCFTQRNEWTPPGRKIP